MTFLTRGVCAVLGAAVLVACGGSALPFRPSNLPADAPLEASDDLVFNGEECGPRAEIDTNRGEIRCYAPGQFDPKFTYTVTTTVKQSDGTEVALLVGRDVRIEPNNEV